MSASQIAATTATPFDATATAAQTVPDVVTPGLDGGLAPQFAAASSANLVIGGRPTVDPANPPFPAGPNPGFSLTFDANGVGYLDYDPQGTSFAAPLRISPDGRTMVIPSSGYGQPDSVLTLNPPAPGFPATPSFYEQINSVQSWLFQARATGETVQVNDFLYGPTGVIQQWTVSNTPGPYWGDRSIALELNKAFGALDPRYAGEFTFSRPATPPF